MHLHGDRHSAGTGDPMKRPAALLLALALAGPAAAQHATHGTHAAADSTTASTRAFREVQARMHREMDIPLTGDPDRDFAAGMIPHHQGAIDMARVELEHGRDPGMRRLAEQVIDAQEKEIALLRAFLAGRN
jgi:uncharacterized protein (DUF305 family)